MLLVASGALVASGTAGFAQPETEVRVERVKPNEKHYQTLRFLKENKDLVRQRLDLLRANTTERGERAGEIDPRFLAYRRILTEALAADSTVAAAGRDGRGLALQESVAALAALEERMALMDSLLAAQRERLAVLQADFAGQQRTALLVLLAGYPRSSALTELSVTLEDGTTHRIELAPEQRESLRKGGVAQVFYGLVEPRAQIVEVAIRGDTWPGGDVGYLQIEPKLDRLTLLKLDASAVQPAAGAPSLRATTWLHEDRLSARTEWDASP